MSYPQTLNNLYEWFKLKREEGVPISGPIFQEKAKDVLEKLNIGRLQIFRWVAFWLQKTQWH